MTYLNFFIFIAFISLSFYSSAETGKLNIAVFLEPPYVDLIENELVGENIDIIYLLAKSIGLKPEFLQCPPVRCLSLIKQGQADMLLGLSKSPEREQHLVFLNPPYLLQHQPLRFYTLKENKLIIKKFSDLEPLLVGTLRGAIYFPLFDGNKAIKKVELTSRKQLVNMLLKGRIDTFLEREETVLPLLTPTEYKNKISVADYQYNKPINSYIVLSKQSKITTHTETLSQTIAQSMADGTIKKIREENRQEYIQRSQDIKKAH